MYLGFEIEHSRTHSDALIPDDCKARKFDIQFTASITLMPSTKEKGDRPFTDDVYMSIPWHNNQFRLK